jgi:hypothetical protein
VIKRYFSGSQLINHRKIVFHDQNIAELGICGGIGQLPPFSTLSGTIMAM